LWLPIFRDDDASRSSRHESSFTPHFTVKKNFFFPFIHAPSCPPISHTLFLLQVQVLRVNDSQWYITVAPLSRWRRTRSVYSSFYHRHCIRVALRWRLGKVALFIEYCYTLISAFIPAALCVRERSRYRETRHDTFRMQTGK